MHDEVYLVGKATTITLPGRASVSIPIGTQGRVLGPYNGTPFLPRGHNEVDVDLAGFFVNIRTDYLSKDSPVLKPQKVPLSPLHQLVPTSFSLKHTLYNSM